MPCCDGVRCQAVSSQIIGQVPQTDVIIGKGSRPGKAMDMPLRIKRIYEPADNDDGKRILVDRLWPRGVSKNDAHIDAWVKDVAPSAELRRWFGHDPKKWDEFRRRYQDELKKNSTAVEELKEQIGQTTATLLYGAKDRQHNNAVVLIDFISKH